MKHTWGEKISRIWYMPFWLYRDIRYEVKMAWQRLFKGYDDRLVWDMRSELPRILAKAFKQLNENRSGFVESLGEEQWGKVLAEIQVGFETWNRLEEKGYSATEKERKEAKVLLDNSFALMAKYFENLWD